MSLITDTSMQRANLEFQAQTCAKRFEEAKAYRAKLAALEDGNADDSPEVIFMDLAWTMQTKIVGELRAAHRALEAAATLAKAIEEALPPVKGA